MARGLLFGYPVPPLKFRFIKVFGYFAIFAASSASSRVAKAQQEASQNMNVEVQVTRPCSVSSERGLSGAELDGGCPTFVKQALIREFAVGTAFAGAGVTEQLVLVINF